MERRPCQATSWDFMGHVQGRGKGPSAPREVGDSPAEGDEGQGVRRPDSWAMQKQADGSGTRTSPRNAFEARFCRTAICNTCGMKPTSKDVDD
jgi:hypothetical protein